jgi:16S rRNA (guanine(966)-N(2))-methyltransferase RsmD
MRIGSGWAKGLQLAVPAGAATRPTAVKVRAAMLNSLQPQLADCLVLDLFAGSGALGIEAVSRGARGACFVESAPGAVRALRANLAELARRAERQGLEPAEIEVQARDVKSGVAALGRRQARFDVLFMDPPYADLTSWLRELAPELATLAAAAAILVVESAVTAASDELAAAAARGGWQVLKTKTYGDTMVTIFQQAKDGDERKDERQDETSEGGDEE